MINCPICNKAIEDEFALNGHLRLSTDSNHKNYYEQQKTKNQKLKTIETVIQPQLKNIPTGQLRPQLEKILSEHNETSELYTLIRRALDEDRTFEVELKKQYEQKYNKDKQNLESYYRQQHIDFVNQKNREYAAYKKNLDDDYQQKVNELEERIEKARDEEFDVTLFRFHCHVCSKTIPLEPRSKITQLFNDFLYALGAVCPNCINKMGYSYNFWYCNLTIPPPIRIVY